MANTASFPLQEWKERKKFQKLLTAAKKKLSDLEQQHVFDGFRHGGKSQTSLLANQIVTVNSTLLKQALHTIQIPFKRYIHMIVVSCNLIVCSGWMENVDKYFSCHISEKLNLEASGHVHVITMCAMFATLEPFLVLYLL